MHTIVRKILEVYINEKRIPTPNDIGMESTDEYLKKKSTPAERDQVFVTLYANGKVIASSGRISAQKDTTFSECVDNTLLCLEDPRFSRETQDATTLKDIRIRTDIYRNSERRLLQEIDHLDTSREGIIFLSPSYGVMSVILPHMIHIDTSPRGYLTLAAKKARLDIAKLDHQRDYVIYGFTTIQSSDLVS